MHQIFSIKGLRRISSGVLYGQLKPIFGSTCTYEKVTNSLFHTGNCSYFVRDMVPTPSSGKNDLSRDILLENIRSASDTTEIFESLRLHSAIMNPTHQVNALKILGDLEKSGNSSLSKETISKSSEFNKLCKSITTYLPTYSPEKVIEILKYLIQFNVPTKARSVQTCLQLLAKSINDLSLTSIMFLDFLLSHLKSCPLVEALKISLPIVFQANYLIRVDGENNNAIIDMLAYATKNNTSKDCIDKCLNTLVERNIVFTVKNCKSIMLSITNSKSITPSHEILLDKTLSWMSENLDLFEFEDIDLIFTKLINQYVWADDVFYNEHFFNNVAQYAIRHQLDLKQCNYILRKLSRIHFVCVPLLEYMAEKAYSNPMLLENMNPGAIISYLSNASDACYKPPHWEMIYTCFLHNIEHQFMQNDKLELPWMKIALEFASLDVWPKFLYDKIFEKHFLDKFVRENNLLDYLQLQKLYQISKTLMPYSMDHIVSPQELLDKAMLMNQGASKDFPLKGALEKGLGGYQYVLSKVYTEHQHLIDHLVAMRKGGYPIPINQSPPYEEDFEKMPRSDLEVIKANLPPEHYLIAICVTPASSYTLNTQRLRGVPLMYLKSIETFGVKPIAVNIDKWIDMPDHEKIPYLMRLLKISEDQQNINFNHIS